MLSSPHFRQTSLQLAYIISFSPCFFSPHFRQTSLQLAYIISFSPCFLLLISDIRHDNQHTLYHSSHAFFSPLRLTSPQLGNIISFSPCFLHLISDIRHHNYHTFYHSPNAFFSSFQTHIITTSIHYTILPMFSLPHFRHT